LPIVLLGHSILKLNFNQILKATSFWKVLENM
jgi:hypothetical protein